MYLDLVKQLQAFEVKFVDEIAESDLVLDAIFGFSFKADEQGIREPFRSIIEQVKAS